MLQIDDDMLKTIGLDHLPKEERDALLQQIYETLELRVGMRLAEKMSEDQLDEFEKFAVEADIAFARQYLTNIDSNWEKNDAYQQQKQAALAEGIEEGVVVAEYAAYKWLEINFPNYKQVVSEEFDKLKSEIKSDAEKIIQHSQS